MFDDHRTDPRPIHRPTPLLFLALLACTLAAPVPTRADCSGATALTANASRRSSGSELLKVTVASAGALTLDVSSPAADVQPKITFLGTSSDCSSPAGEGTDFDYLWNVPGWKAIEVYDADTLYLEVEPEDSQQTLGDFTLRVAWVAEVSSPDEQTDLSPDATDTCSASSSELSTGDFDSTHYVIATDEIDQWDDDIMQGEMTVPGLLLVKSEDPLNPDFDATLYASDSCAAAAELDSGSFSGGSGRLAAVAHPGVHSISLASEDVASAEFELAVRFYAPCALGETDDHGNTALCATGVSLGGSENGQVANDDDDDVDFFSFVLSNLKSIQVETTGNTDTYGVLYDEDGQRLETDDDDGAGSNFRISRTLGAGRYFARVEGANAAEGSYTLEVSVVE